MQLFVLTAKSALFVPFFAVQDIGTPSAIPLRLPDPCVDGRDAGLDFLRSSSGSMQLDALILESRRIRVSCSRHQNTSPLQ
ncbi:hypothetical protein [Pseudophaeobacter sp. C1-32P7]|uniref:hypothetical protein n=1 Tax=Pseudophaeobacter sp. C1-32P7 TaxID=3098142 RepID=UPI0034D3DF56